MGWGGRVGGRETSRSSRGRKWHQGGGRGRWGGVGASQQVWELREKQGRMGKGLWEMSPVMEVDMDEFQVPEKGPGGSWVWWFGCGQPGADIRSLGRG